MSFQYSMLIPISILNIDININIDINFQNSVFQYKDGTTMIFNITPGFICSSVHLEILGVLNIIPEECSP